MAVRPLLPHRVLVALLLFALSFSAVPPAGEAKARQAKTSIANGFDPGPEWLFTAGIYRKGRLICSGSVLSPTAVVTAGHCVTPTSRVFVRAGTFKAGDAPAIPVSAIIESPYSPHIDVAVLRLASPTSAPAVKLATPAEEAAATAHGAIVNIAGFGDRIPWVFKKARIGRLRTTEMYVANRCQKGRGFRRTKGPGKFDPASDYCLSARWTRRFAVSDACPGDSGGPMAAMLPDGPRLLGIGSFSFFRPDRGYICGDPKGASVYERIAPSYEFIRAAAGL